MFFSVIKNKKFFYFIEDKSYLSEGRRLISPSFRVGSAPIWCTSVEAKRKNKFGRSQATVVA